MTDIEELIAELEHMAKLLAVGSLDIPALLRRATAALAAQAQEIEDCKESLMETALDRDAIEAKTIERCAQEMEKYLEDSTPRGRGIAIRALRHIGREG